MPVSRLHRLRRLRRFCLRLRSRLSRRQRLRLRHLGPAREHARKNVPREQAHRAGSARRALPRPRVAAARRGCEGRQRRRLARADHAHEGLAFGDEQQLVGSDRLATAEGRAALAEEELRTRHAQLLLRERAQLWQARARVDEARRAHGTVGVAGEGHAHGRGWRGRRRARRIRRSRDAHGRAAAKRHSPLDLKGIRRAGARDQAEVRHFALDGLERAVEGGHVAQLGELPDGEVRHELATARLLGAVWERRQAGRLHLTPARRVTLFPWLEPRGDAILGVLEMIHVPERHWEGRLRAQRLSQARRSLLESFLRDEWIENVDVWRPAIYLLVVLATQRLDRRLR